MKFESENWLIGEAKQIGLIPHIDLFWNEGAFCILFGWLFMEFKIWFGNHE